MSAFNAACNATAVVSEPPLPSVVISPFLSIPWKPATITTFPFLNSSSILFVYISFIFALPWTTLVSIPACQPVNDTVLHPFLFNKILNLLRLS